MVIVSGEIDRKRVDSIGWQQKKTDRSTAFCMLTHTHLRFVRLNFQQDDEKNVDVIYS